MHDGDDEHRDSGIGEPTPAPTATPLESWAMPAKLSVARRALAWLRGWRLWRVLRALRGHKLQFGTQEDFDNERIADCITAWARRAACWLLVPAISAGLYLVGEHLLVSTTDLDGLLRSVLASASITSGLLAAGLMSATSQSKQLRPRRVDDLRACQKELQPIQRAFDALLSSLHNRPNIGKSLVRFLDNVRRVGRGWHTHGEYFGHGNLISVEQIADIEAALGDMSGVLYRRKYFMYLVEDLTGTPAGGVYTLDGIRLTQSDNVKHALDRFRPQSDDSWQLLSFWEDLINETHQLAVRTRRLSVEVHHHNPRQLRATFAHLAWLIVVGVGVPLISLALPIEHRMKAGLAAVGTGGLLLVLMSTLILLYRWITQRRLHDEGRLES